MKNKVNISKEKYKKIIKDMVEKIDNIKLLERIYKFVMYIYINSQ
ncbi:hypothetical protein JCM1393_25020 [Clostridium carnis]